MKSGQCASVAEASGLTAVLPKIPHSNSSKRVPNRPLRPRRGRFGTLLQQLECGIFGRTAVYLARVVLPHGELSRDPHWLSQAPRLALHLISGSRWSSDGGLGRYGSQTWLQATPPHATNESTKDIKGPTSHRVVPLPPLVFRHGHVPDTPPRLVAGATPVEAPPPPPPQRPQALKLRGAPRRRLRGEGIQPVCAPGCH